MRVDITMPQMGESIAEGTSTRWIKAVGDKIERDEPIFEISTDKVDAEIPSPAAGTLVEIRNQEGETVPINEVVGVIETDADASVPATAPEAEKPAAKEADEPAPTPAPAATPPSASPTPQPAAAPARLVSPVVRRIADEHGIDPRQVPGTGAGGRVTKKDILAFVASAAATAAPVAAPSPVAPAPAPRVGPVPVTFGPGADTIREPLSVMRKKIAEHMVDSLRTSAHVQSLFEVDMTHCVRLRTKHKQSYVDRHGVKLSYMAFVIKAICDGLRSWPILNSSIDGDDILYKKSLNIGVAVALDWGLIVPVIKHADELSLIGIARAINDLGTRAKEKKLLPDEVQLGTFTITKPGGFGSYAGTPIINQPQVAILGVGAIEKRPAVITHADGTDSLGIRTKGMLSMSYDHRVVDGADGDRFLADLKSVLENYPDEAI